MRRFTIVGRVCVFCALFFSPIAISRAGVTATGDVTPTPISDWTSDTEGRIGSGAAGTVSITNGGALSDRSLIVGYYEGSGQVTISGASSTWQNASDLTVGYYNSGTVTQNAGTVTVGGTLYLGHEYGSGTGTYNLNGGTLGIKALVATGNYAFNFSGGTLRADAGFTTSANATLSGTDTINTNGYDVTWSGVLSGAGELVKTGSGTLTLSGLNTYTGGTDVKAGKLAGTSQSIKGDLNVANGAEVYFGDYGRFTYSDDITGAGTISMRTDGHSYDNGTLLATGLVAPSNSTSTLTVRGNYKNADTTTTQINVGSTSCGTIAVTGTAVVDGTLHISGTTCTSGTKYTFLTATGGVSGTFDSILNDFSNYTVSLTYDAYDIYFTLTGQKRTFMSVAKTWDQLCVGWYLDTIQPTATGDLAVRLNQLAALNDNDLRSVYDTLGMSFDSDMTDVQTEGVWNFMVIMTEQAVQSGTGLLKFMFWLRTLAEDSRGEDSLVYVCRQSSKDSALRARMKGWTTWVQSYGIGATIAGDGNASGINFSNGGAIVGMERNLDERTLFGFCGGYSSTYVNGASASGSIDGGQFGAYMRREYGSAYLSGIGVYGHNNIATQRLIEYTGFSETARANYGGDSYAVGLEAGQYIPYHRVLLQPFAGLAYIGVHQDAFTEHGADPFSLNVDEQNANSFRGTLGTRVMSGFRTKMGKLVTVNGSAAWRHEFLNEHDVVNASFTSDLSGTSFSSVGVNVDRDAAIIGTGANYWLTKNFTVSANYNLQFSQNYTSNAGVGGLQYTW
jgi:outer membrane autotransporter protein